VLTAYLFLEVCPREEERGDKQKLTFVELGAGLGLPGIALYLQGHRVYSTERPLIIDLLNANIQLNITAATGCESDSTALGSIEAIPLEWTEDTDTLERNERLPFLGDRDGGHPCDVVLGSDLIFPNNEECWPALVNVWDQLLSPRTPRPAATTSSSGSIPSLTTPTTCVPTNADDAETRIEKEEVLVEGRRKADCDSQEHQRQWQRQGYLSYEHRSSDVITKFRALLEDRGITCEQCFSDRVTIPKDIHVYKLCKGRS
jgi:hypothetical protein